MRPASSQRFLLAALKTAFHRRNRRLQLLHACGYRLAGHLLLVAQCDKRYLPPLVSQPPQSPCLSHAQPAHWFGSGGVGSHAGWCAAVPYASGVGEGKWSDSSRYSDGVALLLCRLRSCALIFCQRLSNVASSSPWALVTRQPPRAN